MSATSKIIMTSLIATIVVGLVSFSIGRKYGRESTIPTFGRQGNSAGIERVPRTGMNGVGFTGGEVLSIDNMSITLKLRDGGSKIVYFASSTQFMKNSSGSINDISVGKQLTVNGKINSDSSITAETIQIRPTKN